LADFQKNIGKFKEREVLIVAASVDQLADAQKTVAEHGLSFAVGYGLDAREIANRYGAFFEEEKKFLHATGFLIKPDGSVCNAVYSTGPIGRLTAADSLRLIDYFQKQKA